MPGRGCKRNRSSVTLLLFFNFKHKRQQNSQIHGASNLTSSAHRSCAELCPGLLTISNPGAEGWVRRNFSNRCYESYSKEHSAEFSANIRICTKSPQYLVARSLAPSLSFV